MKAILTTIVAVLVLLVFACEGNEDYSSIPSDIRGLVELKGAVDAPDVYIFLQGGPVFGLDLNYFDGFAEKTEALRVYPYQGQMLDPAFETAAITFAKAEEVGAVSVEILHDVVSYFAREYTNVYVVSHSFGSFIVPAWLDTYGNEADAVVMLAGRLDMPDEVWEGFRDGTVYNFPDGRNHTVQSELEEGNPFGNRNSQLFAAALGQNRFTELLDDVDLTKLLYVYGTADTDVGSLTADEHAFLVDNGATVLAIPDGGHNVAFTPEVITTIEDWLRK